MADYLPTGPATLLTWEGKMAAGSSAYQDHGCRVYWGHCGCDLYRGHDGPHIGLHLNDDCTDVTAAHVIAQDYPHLFGEDAPESTS